MVRLTNSCVFLLVPLAVKRADDRQTGQHLAADEVDVVHALLHGAKLRHGDLHEHADEQQHRRDGQRDDPAEAGSGARDHDNAAEADDRRIEHDAHDQHAHRLDLRDVVRGARDERGRRELVHLGGRERQHLAEHLRAQVAPDAKIEVRGNTLPYVSRGGLKLEKAMQCFPLTPNGKVCMDIGASTGGFTDCMLQNSAVKVYAIDVGYGQLAWKLRCDERVINLERTNIRHVTEKEVPELLDFASVDVSFISLKLVLPVLYRLLKEGGEAVCLIKPQFEAGRELVGKKGVVREESTHVMVVENALSFAKDNGFTPIHLTFSPVKGPEGNIEYLMHLKKGEYESALPIPAEIVRLSHQTLSE